MVDLLLPADASFLHHNNLDIPLEALLHIQAYTAAAVGGAVDFGGDAAAAAAVGVVVVDWLQRNFLQYSQKKHPLALLAAEYL